MSQRKVYDMTNFFMVLAEAVKPFRSPHSIKGHNIDGCRVIQGRRGGNKESYYLFSFIARGAESTVDIEVDMAKLINDPKGYCDQLMDSLDQIFKRVRLDQRVLVAAPDQVPSKEKPSLQLVRGALH